MEDIKDFIKYVQVETSTICNQRCYYCPVSVKRRPNSTLQLADLEKVISDLKGYAIEKIHINGFNEPTLDNQIIEKVSLLRQNHLPVSFLSNASGLTESLSERLIDTGVMEFIINISTIDPEEYRHTRGFHDPNSVFRHIEYLLARGKTHQTKIVLLMLGRLDKMHASNINSIMKHFEQYLYEQMEFQICPVADYAANLTSLLDHKIHHRNLRGCISQRQREWLHIAANGDVILCCQDYMGDYHAGNIKQEDITSILNNETMREYRRFIEGEVAAADDFICRHCVFAISDDNYIDRGIRLFCSKCILKDQIKAVNACEHCVIAQMMNSLSRR